MRPTRVPATSLAAESMRRVTRWGLAERREQLPQSVETAVRDVADLEAELLQALDKAGKVHIAEALVVGPVRREADEVALSRRQPVGEPAGERGQIARLKLGGAHLAQGKLGAGRGHPLGELFLRAAQLLPPGLDHFSE